LLKRSIRNRFPFIDLRNYIQIELLQRYRSSDTSESIVRHTSTASPRVCATVDRPRALLAQLISPQARSSGNAI
jgi:hypothetical protein